MIRPLPLVVLTLLPGAGLAQSIILEPVVLSGGLTPIAPDAFGRAYTVLTATDIADRGFATVQDALRALPGVSVSSSGNSLTAVRIRGGEARQVLVLIDGIEATGGSDEYTFSGLETADIERIEVLRGPQSVYYGSNASSGVINIITRKGGEGQAAGAGLELGNGAAGNLWVTNNGPRGGLALSFSTRDDHGFDQSGSGGEKDGIRRRTLAASGWVQATDDLRLGASLRRAQEKYDFDADNWLATTADDYIIDTPGLTSERREFQGGVWAELSSLDGRLVQRLDYQDTVFRQWNYGAWTRGETRKLKYRASFGLDGQAVADSAHLLSLLAERQRDESSTAPDFRRDLSSIALEYRGFYGNGLDVQAGLRRDFNKAFDDATSWNIGLSWQVPDQPFRLHASAGNGIVNPAYAQLFGGDYGAWVYAGNPDLKPERNRGFDLGVEATLPNGLGVVDVTYFNEKLRDEIEDYFQRSEGGISYFGYRNQQGDSPRQGLEVAARLRASDRLDVALSYTYLDAKNPDGSVEVRRPRHEIGLSATWSFADGRGQVTGDLRHVAGNYDARFFGDYATAQLPDHTVVGVSAGYDLTDRVRLTGRITNLFDANYSDVWGYAAQGRTAYVGVQARW